MLMKGAALAALAAIYFAQPWHWTQPWHLTSGLVIAAGFTLNLIAARTLGHTRTYYGWELGDLPQPRVTAFPYSVMPHPMLIGNMVAFGGTLLHPDFRQTWWPLAILHVALNGALIVMETAVAPRRRTERTGAVAAWARRGEPPALGPRLAECAVIAAASATLAALAVVAVMALGWPAGPSLAGSGPAGWGPIAIVAGASAAYGYARRGWYVADAAPGASSGAARIHDRDHSREAAL
jgi:hypothetical protein